MESHDDYDLSKKVLDSPSTMVCFEVEGGDEGGRKLMDSLKTATQAVSIGGVESLIYMTC